MKINPKGYAIPLNPNRFVLYSPPATSHLTIGVPCRSTPTSLDTNGDC